MAGAADTKELPAPKNDFYAHAGRAEVTESVVRFAFGQLDAASRKVRAVLGIDVPTHLIEPMADTFDDGFRSALADAVRLYPGPQLEADFTEPHFSAASPAHMVRIAISPHSAVLDFYRLEVSGGDLAPVVRVRTFPPVAAWFATVCDRVLAKGKK
ncbi:MAG TPA: hypothetical protein VKE22_02865 [Haliangiales bacterium]|nr:hypothetical protein [Haliangiales bacterium]